MPVAEFPERRFPPILVDRGNGRLLYRPRQRRPEACVYGFPPIGRALRTKCGRILRKKFCPPILGLRSTQRKRPRWAGAAKSGTIFHYTSVNAWICSVVQMRWISFKEHWKR